VKKYRINKGGKEDISDENTGEMKGGRIEKQKLVRTNPR
jgi:hypothetical protein